MMDVHSSHLHMRELHRADLLDEAAQVRLAAQANSQRRMTSGRVAVQARLATTIDALSRLWRLPLASGSCVSARSTSPR